MRRGFTLIEVIIAMGLLVFAGLVFFSVFSTSSHHATQSRNRAVATLLAESYLEEIEAHPYGAPEPEGWTRETEEPVRLWLEGRQQHLIFHKSFEYANGGFVGRSDEEQDTVTFTISWREAVGGDQVEGEDTKSISVQVPVWRGR